MLNKPEKPERTETFDEPLEREVFVVTPEDVGVFDPLEQPELEQKDRDTQPPSDPEPPAPPAPPSDPEPPAPPSELEQARRQMSERLDRILGRTPISES